MLTAHLQRGSRFDQILRQRDQKKEREKKVSQCQKSACDLPKWRLKAFTVLRLF